MSFKQNLGRRFDIHEIGVHMDMTKEVAGFSGYEIAFDGRVYNQNTGRTLTPTRNSRGIAMVGLMKNGVQHKRSLARLVADHFLLYQNPPPAFDTPIHLDGDRMNCHAQNLVWRPIWFARMYHDQFRYPVPQHGDHPIEDVDTLEQFENVRSAAMKFGLLEKEIILGIHNNVPTFPTWQTFRFLSL